MLGQFGLFGAPHLHLVSLIIVGGFAGWAAGLILGWRHGVILNVAVGVLGLWIGSQLASLVDVMVLGSLRQFLVALIGSLIVLAIWRTTESRVGVHL